MNEAATDQHSLRILSAFYHLITSTVFLVRGQLRPSPSCTPMEGNTW